MPDQVERFIVAAYDDNPGGQWVCHSDYEKLEVRLAATERVSEKYGREANQFEAECGRIRKQERERLGLERGYIPQPFWNDFGDEMMKDAAVVAALDKFSFDGRGYSVATANRMREAFVAAFTVTLATLEDFEYDRLHTTSEKGRI